MEIICKSCDTEYEFDDALVSERGTTVRCTHCGEQFRVFRPPTTRPERWVIRRGDGRELVFTNLRDLQQAIVNVQVGRRDLLTHDNDAPRPLGSIAELEPFFADRAMPSPPPPPVQPEVGASRGSRSGRSSLDGPPDAPPRGRDTWPPRAPYTADEEPQAGTLASEPPRAEARISVPSEEPPHDDAYGGEQQWFDEPRFTSVSPRRSRLARWFVVLTLLGALGLAIATVGRKYAPMALRAPASASTAGARVESLLEEANKALAEGDIETAKEAFDKASVLSEHEPRVLTGLARLEAVRADADWLKVRLLPAQPADVLAAAKRQAEQSAARAQRAADQAATLASDDPKVARAKIDALRLAGDLNGARALVPQVTAISGQPETTYVLAALDLAEQTPNWPVVVDRLKAAAAGEPNAQRTSAALVFALVRAGDLQLAKAELEKISAAPRPYPLLAELSAFVARALGSAPASAGRAEVGKREAAPAASPARAAAPRSEAESPAADYRMLLQSASQAAGARQYDRAEQLYRMALVKNPGDTEALGGLGDVARARGNAGLARTYYEQVLAKNPQYLPSLNALADLDWDSGDRASAVKRYSELIEMSPSSPLATRARNRIAEAQSNREDSKRSSAEPSRGGVEPKSVPSSPAAEKPVPPSSDLPPGVDTSDLPGFHR